MENIFFKLDETMGQMQDACRKVLLACERNDAHGANDGLLRLERTLQFARSLDLAAPLPVGVPDAADEQAKYVARHKYCSCCGAFRGLAPLNSSTGVDATVVIAKYKKLQRNPGCSYEVSPSLIGHAGVWRNGGSCGESYVCTDCLTVGMRVIRDKINEVLGESDCVPTQAQQLP